MRPVNVRTAEIRAFFKKRGFLFRYTLLERGGCQKLVRHNGANIAFVLRSRDGFDRFARIPFDWRH